MKLAIIVPEYNENHRAIITVKNILKTCKCPVIVIDDGSKDGSFKAIRNEFKKNDRVIARKHLINLGKGAAMKTGVELAWTLGFDTVIFVDADGQHNPKHLKKFERKLQDYPIVFGYRSMGRNMPWIRKTGNKMAAGLIKTLFNIKKKDLLSGYLGFRKEVYSQICWNSQRYGIETEMAAKIGRNKIKFAEIKIDTIYIDKYKGVSIIDALKVLLQIPFWYFTS